MCGRYTLSAGHEALARAFLAEFAEELRMSWQPRYNIAPGSGVVAVLEDRDRDGARRAEILHWGLVPRWAKDPKVGYKLINARAETIGEKAAYGDAFRYRRCLVPASGFYEWDRRGSPPQPYYFHPAGEAFMALAGIWEYWLHPSGSEIVSVALVTTAAVAPVAGIHHRMPLILPRRTWAAWLDTREIKPSMEAFQQAAAGDGPLAYQAVSTAVNRAQADGPGLIMAAQPAVAARPEPPRQGELF